MPYAFRQENPPQVPMGQQNAFMGPEILPNADIGPNYWEFPAQNGNRFVQYQPLQEPENAMVYDGVIAPPVNPLVDAHYGLG